MIAHGSRRRCHWFAGNDNCSRAGAGWDASDRWVGLVAGVASACSAVYRL